MFGELDHRLYRAFNVPGEILSRGSLDNSIRGTRPGRLSPAEWVALGSQTRAELENNLSDTDYRVLKSFYTEPGNLDQTLMTIEPLHDIIRKSARIYAEIHPRFFELACVSACWNQDLFRDARYGPMQKYVLPGKTRTLMGQRKRRLKITLEAMRTEAKEKARQLEL